MKLGRADTAPWITAGALGVVAIALGAVVLFVIRPQRDHREDLARAVGVTSTQQAAMNAATQEGLNLTTYSRKNFPSDYARTVAGATGSLMQDLDDTAKRSALLSNMQKGKFDLQGQVLNTAFETQAGDRFSVLVLALSYQVTDNGTRTLSSRNRFEMTLVRAGDKYLVSDLKSVGLI
jgi:hypothetical protein